MTRPLVCIVDVATGEEVIREMNDAEYEDFLARTGFADETSPE